MPIYQFWQHIEDATIGHDEVDVGWEIPTSSNYTVSIYNSYIRQSSGSEILE